MVVEVEKEITTQKITEKDILDKIEELRSYVEKIDAESQIRKSKTNKLIGDRLYNIKDRMYNLEKDNRKLYEIQYITLLITAFMFGVVLGYLFEGYLPDRIFTYDNIIDFCYYSYVIYVIAKIFME